MTRSASILCLLALGCSGSRDGQSIQVGTASFATMEGQASLQAVTLPDAGTTVAAATGFDAGPATLAMVGPSDQGDAESATTTSEIIKLDNNGPACKHHDDCVVSCFTRADDCCGQLCGCTTPYHRKRLATIVKKQKAICAEPGKCPVASCARPTARAVPRCLQSRCVTEMVPLPDP